MGSGLLIGQLLRQWPAYRLARLAKQPAPTPSYGKHINADEECVMAAQTFPDRTRS